MFSGGDRLGNAANTISKQCYHITGFREMRGDAEQTLAARQVYSTKERFIDRNGVTINFLINVKTIAKL